MRYLPIEKIKENAVLATPIYNDNGVVLLNANVVLKRAYLDKLSKIGYPGLYIYDDLSKGVAVKELLSEELRLKSIKSFTLIWKKVKTKKLQLLRQRLNAMRI